MSVEINETNFPDEAFRSYISTNFDTDEDGWLNDDELLNATNITLPGSIQSLSGINLLTNLTYLYADNFEGTRLDIHNCQNLLRIQIRWNDIIEFLDASNNPKLETLICNSSDSLQSIVFDNCPSLKKFSIYHDDNYEGILDFSNCPNIEHIDCFLAKKLTSLICAGCSKLKYIDAYEASLLSVVDLTGCVSLRIIEFNSTALTKLDLPDSPILHVLSIKDTAIDHVNISKSSVLADLYSSQDSTKNGNNLVWVRNSTVSEADYVHDAAMHNSTQSAIFRYDKIEIYKDTVIMLSALKIITQPEDITFIESDSGKSLSIEASGDDLEYSWEILSPNENLWSVIDDATTNTYYVENSQQYDGAKFRCRVVSSLEGMILSREATVIRLLSPVIVSHPQNKSTTEGATAKFEIEASGNDLTYQWQSKSPTGDWTFMRNSDSPEYEVLVTTSLNNYQYRCCVKNEIGEVYSNAATLTVTTDASVILPVITTQPSSVSTTDGSAATFSVEASGSDISYQWQVYKNDQWTNILEANDSSYSLTATKATGGNKYRCVISNAAGAVYSDPVTLTVTTGVYVSTPRVLTQPRSVNADLGELVTFWIRADGGDLSYQWQKLNNGTWYDITGATSASYVVMAKTEVHNTQYRCAITNTAGSVTSNTATLSIRAGHDLSFYGYHSIIISGKNTYGEWEMYPTSRPHVAPPEVKTSYVDLPGADGGLDYTDLLTGEPRYGYRKGSWEFLLIPQDKWASVYRSLVSFLHGRQHTVILEDDPDYVYTGRLSVNEWQSAAHNSLITIDYILEPFPRNISGQEEDEEENQILSMASTLLNKEKYAGMVIGKLNGAATLIYPDMLFDDGDNIAY